MARARGRGRESGFREEVEDGYHRFADVTGAASGTASAIRLTVTAHPFHANDKVIVASPIGGVTGWNPGQMYPITIVDANTVELVGTTFGGSFTSGGRLTR